MTESPIDEQSDPATAPPVAPSPEPALAHDPDTSWLIVLLVIALLLILFIIAALGAARPT
jgi:hypothetical protein